jgi:hypothetical protein
MQEITLSRKLLLLPPFHLLHLHCHHALTTMMYQIGRREEATNLVWRLPKQRLKSWPPWVVCVCLLANLPSKNTLTTTQQHMLTHPDQNGQQWPSWCPTPGASIYNSHSECWLIVVCGGAGNEVPWRPCDDGGCHGRWSTILLALASFYLTKNYFSDRGHILNRPDQQCKINNIAAPVGD